MTRAHEARGGIVPEVLFGILTVLCAAATYAVAAAAIAKGDRTALAISLVPGGITVAFAFTSILMDVQRRKEKAIADRRSLNPDEPWLWTDAWRDGRIRSTSSWGTAAIVIVFAAIWNAAVAGGGLAVYWSGGDLWSRPAGVVFLVIFALVGVALIACAVYLVLSAMKYPPTVFEMSAVPGVLGGHLGGSIDIPAPVPAGAEARVKLECVRTVHSRSAGPETGTLWQSELTATIPGGGRLPVAFTIPFNLPPSELPELRGRPSASPFSWSLSVRVSLPGVDYIETFEVPVFATRASDRSIVAGAAGA
jgi:hypothetical protein